MVSEPLWIASEQRRTAANLTRFMGRLAAIMASSVADYDALHTVSVREPELFWAAVWEEMDVRASCRGDIVLASAARPRDVRFFPEARLNYAENLLCRRNDESPGAGVSRRKQGQDHRLVGGAQRQGGAPFPRSRGGGDRGRRPGLCGRAQSPGHDCHHFSPSAPSAPSGPRAHPISASAASSTGSARLRRACSSPATAITTTARPSTSVRKSATSPRMIAGLEQILLLDYIGEARAQATKHSRRAQPRRRGGRNERRAHTFRPAAVRPPPLHPLFVRHHGRSQVHRSPRRRHSPQASDGAGAQYRSQEGGPSVLLQHLRVDDVELARLGAGRGGDPAAL